MLNTTFPPVQKETGPPAAMVGVAGIGLTVTVDTADAVEGQLAGEALVATTV